MALLNVTKEDRLKGKVFPVDWYNCEVKSRKEKVAKSGTSTNHTYQCDILDGPFKGGSIYCMFNTAAIGKIAPFLEGCGMDLPENEEDFSFDPDAPVGRKLKVYNGNRMYEGRPQNDPSDFRPLD